ncbi:MAG: glycine oxidase ThiO [Pyrinomonadaceae bacterium]
MSSDILIIGGGVIGLSIARELHKRGSRSICVVEKGITGRESSWAAAGMLGPQAEAEEFGELFDLCSASRDLYPKFAAELLDDTGIDIELERSGTLSLAFTDKDSAELMVRHRQQRDAGLNIELLSAEEVQKFEPCVSASVQMGLFFANDWQVENRRLVEALRRYAELNGIEIREHTYVNAVAVVDGRVTGVETDSGTIHAKNTVLATGAWTSLIKLGHSEMPLAVEPVRGQMISFRTRPGQFRHVISSRRGYLVPRVDGRVLAGSTTERVGFANEVTDEAFRELRQMASEISPFLNDEPEDAWSGLRPYSPDGYLLLGRLEGIEGLMIATAHYRNGILLAPLTAEIVASDLTDGTVSEHLRTFGVDVLSKSV